MAKAKKNDADGAMRCDSETEKGFIMLLQQHTCLYDVSQRVYYTYVSNLASNWC